MEADVKKCRIDAAAQYGIHSSSRLLKVMRDSSPSDGERRALKSVIFEGDAVFSMDRWGFWKDKFLSLVETTPEASYALQRMRIFEQ